MNILVQVMISEEIFNDLVYFQFWSQIEAYTRGQESMLEAFQTQNTPELCFSRPVDIQNIFCFDLTSNIRRDRGFSKVKKNKTFFFIPDSAGLDTFKPDCC